MEDITAGIVIVDSHRDFSGAGDGMEVFLGENHRLGGATLRQSEDFLHRGEGQHILRLRAVMVR